MVDYESVKTVHRIVVALSIAGFSLRGLLMLSDSALLRRRWMRTWPHLIDTLLLASGLWLAYTLRLNPLEHHWLAIKVLALLAYIWLGFIALRLGRTRRSRIAALAAALGCFAYMAGVAVTKSPLPGSTLADVVQLDRDLRYLRFDQTIPVDREIA